MEGNEISHTIDQYAQGCLSGDLKKWLNDKIYKIVEEESIREFFLTYSLLGEKVNPLAVKINGDKETDTYLKKQEVNALEIARIHFLSTILSKKSDVFTPQVAKILQVADSNELETFLKFLIFLPRPEDFKMVAVDALRT
ncbi:MAG: hypothetical protein WA951_05145, partial [Leeuwenhoekiella sp.]